MEKSLVVWLNCIPAGSLTCRHLFTLNLSFLLLLFTVSSVAFGYQLAAYIKKKDSIASQDISGFSSLQDQAASSLIP